MGEAVRYGLLGIKVPAFWRTPRRGVPTMVAPPGSDVEDFRDGGGAEAVGFGHVGAEEGAAVVEEVLGDAIGFGVDEVVGHVAGFPCYFGDVNEFVIDGVVEDGAFDGDGAVDVVPHGELDGFFTDFAGLAGVAVGLDAHEGALEVSEGVGADAFDFEAVADGVCEEVAEGAGAGELDVSVGVAFFFSEEFDDHGCAVGVGDAFRDGDGAHAVFGIDAIDIGEELLGFEVAFGEVDEVWAVVEVFLGEGGGGGEEAGVAAHDTADINALEGAVVEVDALECLGDESSCGAEAGAVVVFHEVVVDGFGDVDGAEFVVGRLGLFVNDADGVRGVVSADVEEVADVVGFHDLEHAGAVFFVGFVAGGEEAGGGGACDLFEVVCGFAGEIDEVFVDDSGDAVDGAVDGGDLGEFAGFEGDADDALVDDWGGAAALGDENFSF